MIRALFLLPLMLLACTASPHVKAPVAETPGSQGSNVSSPSSPAKQSNETPVEVGRCLSNPVANGKVDLQLDQEPGFYLKGDFDGDGQPDYAVAIKGRMTHRNGIVICTGKGNAFLLGADNPKTPPFSDMPEDNFMSSNWAVYSKQEAEELYNIEKQPPTRAAFPKGESIALIWEDGIGVIWWDGSRYRWGVGL